MSTLPDGCNEAATNPPSTKKLTARRATRLTLVRIDDLGPPDASGHEFLAELCHEGLTISCGIIPRHLSDECKHFLLRLADTFPGQVELHQHGYQHKNHGTDLGKFEFSSRRPATIQLGELLRGRQILERAFGARFFPAFSAPFGAVDASLVDLLSALRFRAVSGIEGGIQLGKVPNFSTDIDFFTWDPTRERCWDDISAEWQRRGSSRTYCGFVLHPQFMSSQLKAQCAAHLPTLLCRHRSVGFATLVSCFTAEETGMRG